VTFETGSEKLERARRDAEREDASLLVEPDGQPALDGSEGTDGPGMRRVRMPTAQVAGRSASSAGPSPLIAALAAVVRDAMEKDGF
jgi:hypothetical protein